MIPTRMIRHWSIKARKEYLLLPDAPIVESAKMIRDEHRVAGMIGGLQLFETDKQLDRTIDYLMNCDIKYLYPCHCVSLKAKCKMSKRLNLSEVVVGLRIDI